MKTSRIITALFLLATVLAVPVSAGATVSPDFGPGSAAAEGQGENLKLVKHLDTGSGTDAEVLQKGKKWYVFANSPAALADGGGINVIDVTNPPKAKVVANIPCVASQGDVQISFDQKTLLSGLSSGGGPESCMGLGKDGFQLFDISNPLQPKVVGFADSDAAHNLTAHPTKPYVYVSLGSLTAAGPSTGHFQVWSIKNPAKPELVNTVLSQPHAPHDISFTKDGKYAVTAAVDHWDIFDTSDPENPTLVFETQCPGCTITHDAKFSPDGTRILIGDEGGGGLPYPCPGGAFYVYDFTTPPVPVLTGVYWPANFVTNQEGGASSCTSHVFDISEDGTKIAISWYTLGTRYIDITDAIGLTVGANRTPTGMKECGWFVPEGGDSWASKFGPGDRWIFSNDIARGFDVFKIEDTECA